MTVGTIGLAHSEVGIDGFEFCIYRRVGRLSEAIQGRSRAGGGADPERASPIMARHDLSDIVHGGDEFPVRVQLGISL